MLSDTWYKKVGVSKSRRTKIRNQDRTRINGFKLEKKVRLKKEMEKKWLTNRR